VTNAPRIITLCAKVILKSRIVRPLPLTAVSRLLEDTSPAALKLSVLELPEGAVSAQVR